MEEIKKRWEVWLIYADHDYQWKYARSIEELKPTKILIDNFKNAHAYATNHYGKNFKMVLGNNSNNK